MKGMGIKVKILSQEAVDFMQFDPMHKVEDILRDMASRVLPDRYAHSLPPSPTFIWDLAHRLVLWCVLRQ